MARSRVMRPSRIRSLDRDPTPRLPGGADRRAARCEDAAMVQQADARSAPPVGLAEIRAARALLADVITATPTTPSRALSELCAGPVLLKCENLQRTGSFKIRGAYTRLRRLDPGRRAAGVVAASAGNHAQGVALAAHLLGIKATVFMPERAAIPKVGATRGYGAE